MSGNIPGVDLSAIGFTDELAPTQREVIGAIAFNLLADAVGRKKLREHPLIIDHRDTLQWISRTFECENSEQHATCVQHLLGTYRRQETRRYLGLLKDICGNAIDIGLIGDIEQYQSAIDAFCDPWCDSDEKKEYAQGQVLAVYHEAQVPEAHRFLYAFDGGSKHYLEKGEHIDQVQAHDAEVLGRRGLVFSDLGDILLRIFKGDGAGLLGTGTKIELEGSSVLSRMHCPFPYCAHDVYLDLPATEHFKLTGPDGNVLQGDSLLWHLTLEHRLVRCSRRQEGERVTAESILKFLK